MDPAVLTGDPGLRCRRVHLDRPLPVLQVVEVHHQAGGQFGSGFKSRRVYQRAVARAGHDLAADEIILATSRQLMAKMLAMDLPHRVQRHFGLPVTLLGVRRKNKA